MTYPKFRAAQATVGIKKPRLSPGLYEGRIVSVEDAPGFVPGEAIKITHYLEKDGVAFDYSEIIMTDARHKRTADFMHFLEENGYDPEYLGDLIGVKERVELLKEDKGPRGVHLNIHSRKFITDGGETEDGTA